MPKLRVITRTAEREREKDKTPAQCKISETQRTRRTYQAIDRRVYLCRERGSSVRSRSRIPVLHVGAPVAAHPMLTNLHGRTAFALFALN